MSHPKASRASNANEETPETMTPKPRAITNTARRSARALGLALALLGLSAASAAAEPVFDVSLEHDAAIVTDTDERVDYTVEVSNTAPRAESPQVGETLTCNPGSWNGSPTFSYQWIRNGAALESAEDIANGSQSKEYELQAADQGEAVQCRVTGESSTAGAIEAFGNGTIASGSNVITNVTATQGTFAVGMGVTLDGSGLPPNVDVTIVEVIPAESKLVISAEATINGNLPLTATTPVGAAAVATSLPVTVADPQPSPAPPSGTSRPGISPILRVTYNEATEEFEQINGGVFVEPLPFVTCTAPSGWSGTGIDWSFRWVRNGEDLGTANVVETTPTTSKYELQLADLHSAIQCEAIAEDANNFKAVAVSRNREVGLAGNGSPSTESPSTVSFPALTETDTSGPVTLEVELPHSPGTYAFETSGGGWSCQSFAASPTEPAKVRCTRSDTLKAQGSYPALGIVTALDEAYEAPETLTATATVGGGGAAVNASATKGFALAPRPFGLTRFETGVCDEPGIGVGTGVCAPYGADFTQAGGHPFVGVAEFDFPTKRRLNPAGEAIGPVEEVKQVFTDLPRGFVGNALAVPELCPDTADLSGCPAASIVGGIALDIAGASAAFPLYAIEPEFGTPAQFAFEDLFDNVYTLSARLRPEEGYAVSLDLAPAPAVELFHSTATVCGFGGNRAGNGEFDGCKEKSDSDANPKPLFTNPTRCEGPPPTVRVKLNSWENPSRLVEAEWSTPAITGCEKVDFDPEISLEPTSSQADSPTGLGVELEMPTEGLETKTGISQANFKRARIAFPEGMAINASAGHGLGACSAEQAGFSEQGGKLVPNDQPDDCPKSSKIGTIEIETPVLQRTLTGGVHIAKQGDVDGALVGLWLIFESKRDGIVVKQPAKVELDPETGQLTTVVDESPEAPFSKVRMSFPGGDRATLLTPPKCGTYEIEAELSSWAASNPDNPKPSEIVTDTTSFEVTEGPNGDPCPTDALLPTLNSGSTNPLAGQTSPFTMRLHRDDGTDRFKALTLRPPAGLTAYLKGAALCPEPLIAKAQGREEPGEGQDELDNPSCPQASQLGRVIAGAGAGPNPYYVDHGKAYLAGPYKGAPLSILTIVPAVAGPLDLGNAVVRNAVHVDPKTAEIRVVSDPIPHILHGILLDVRDVRVVIDRPNFTNNPTSCAPKHIFAEVKGLVETAIAQPSNPFQVGGCAALGFKPRTSVQLFGGVKRGSYQGVRAVVRPRPGDANIDRAVVRFPRSAFVAQEHLKNICTRVQFAAEACPPSSIYGKAVAWSPLLGYPLEGNVHLRSSNNVLPDLVADLRGPAHQPIKVEVAIRNDSVKGALRNTVQSVPDAPVSYFRLQTFGGDKGLIVNSRNICGRNQARVAMNAHNGRRSVETVNVFNRRCKALKRKQRAKRKAAKRSMQRTKARAAVARASARHG